MQDTGGEVINTETLVSLNNLNYNIEPDCTVAVNATYKKHFFANTTAEPNRSNMCVLNSGADYIDMRRSFLSFDFSLTSSGSSSIVQDGAAPQTAANLKSSSGFMANAVPTRGLTDIGFGGGSALNLIQRIVVQSRSGDEICRVENAAYINHVLLNYCYGQDYAQSVGSDFGFGNKKADTRNGSTVQDSSYYIWKDVYSVEQVKRRFNIPMYLLSGFFNYDRLLPSMLCSGLRIQIDFSPIKEALVMSRPNEQINSSISYVIENLHIDAKSIQLTDAVQRFLNEVSATSGLEVVYTDINSTNVNVPTGGGEFHVEVRQACARAIKAWARVRDARAQTDYLRDSYAADDWLIPSFQWRLGSLYFPQQPVKSYNTDRALARPIMYDVPVSSSATSFDVSGLSSYLDSEASAGFGGLLSNIGEAHMLALEMFGKLGEKSSECLVSRDLFARGEIPLFTNEGGFYYNTNSTVLDQARNYWPKSYSDAFDSDANKFVKAYILGSYRAAAPAKLPEQMFNGESVNNRHPRSTSGPLSLWTSVSSDWSHYNGNHSIIPVNLERSTLFNMSGVPINNSRVLGLEMIIKPRILGNIITCDSQTNTLASLPTNTPVSFSTSNVVGVQYPLGGVFQHKCDVYLQYVRLARVFMNNVEIEQ